MTSKKHRIDAAFLLSISVLIVLGLLIFTSAALGLLARDGQDMFTSIAVRQLLLGLVFGSALLVFFSRIDYRAWKPYAAYLFIGTLFLTLLTFVPGIGLSLKGASRWILIGSFSFQPEELVKLGTVAFLAAVYSAHLKTVPTLRGGLLPLFSITGPVALVLLLQPNTAGAIILGVASVAMLFVAGGRVRHIAALALIGLLAVGIAAYMRPYVAERIETFLNQSSDPLGAGWQSQQAFIAVGSGGVYGRGFGQSIQKFSYLPEPIGDSVFAVVGEEFGFVGASFLVLCFAAAGVLGLRIAARAADPFGSLLVVGLIVMIIGQSFFNIASTLGLVPLIGVPLIFVSHGGTALAMALAEVGVILSVSRRMKPGV